MRDEPDTPAPVTVDAFGVAVMLGLPTAQAFLTRRARLEKRGFPKPLPLRPLRWAPQAIEDWARDRERIEAAANARRELAGLREDAHPIIRALEKGNVLPGPGLKRRRAA